MANTVPPPSSIVPRPKLTRRRKLAFAALAMFLGLLLAALATEALFRVLEYRQSKQMVFEGTRAESETEGRWGWRPKRGWFHTKTSEYDCTGSVNDMYMNDDPVDPAADAHKTRVLALGDSHTFAVGVSAGDTWPKVLQRRLNEQAKSEEFRCYNLGTVGYNLDQYLLRLIDQGPLLKPHYVVLGLSEATDLYDLLPPSHGGWIYGADAARDYFDFDPVTDQLVQMHWPPPTVAGSTSTNARRETAGSNSAASIREFLQHFATFRYLRRSPLALSIGSHLHVGGKTLWPNMEVVAEKEISPGNKYAWRLAEAILLRTAEECRRQNAKLIIVDIPYLPQVYDDIWGYTFGSNPRYSQTAASDRLKAWCSDHDITFVETRDALRAKSREIGRWVHFHQDGHPTLEGHQAIADAIAKADLIHPAHDPAADH